jgi:predicted enzyme related to lactoylglutathione lyase
VPISPKPDATTDVYRLQWRKAADPPPRSRSLRAAYRAPMAIARFPSIVLDCPDPAALAAFYGALLDWKAEVSANWAEVRAEYGQCISFQQVQGYTPPSWPGQQVPQQMHIDVIVDDLDAAETAVLALGAIKHEHQPGTTFRVFLDPAGHPFCLCAC